MISILAISSNPEMAVFLGFERSFLVLRLIFRCTRVVGALFDTCWIIPFLRNKLNGNNANLETNLVSFDCWVPQNIARIFVSCFHLWLVLCDTIDINMPPPPPPPLPPPRSSGCNCILIEEIFAKVKNPASGEWLTIHLKQDVTLSNHLGEGMTLGNRCATSYLRLRKRWQLEHLNEDRFR